MGRPLLLLLALAAAGCQSGAPRPAAPASRPRYTKPMSPEWFEEEIAAAEEEFEGGHYAAALRRVYAARAREPSPEQDALLLELLTALNRKVLELDVIQGRVDPEEDPISFDQDVRVRVRLANEGVRPLRIPARLPDASPSLFLLDIVRRDYDIHAQVVETRLQIRRELPRDIEIPPGGTTELVLALAGTGNDRPLAGIRTFTISGLLRPCVIEVGDLRRWDPVPLEPGTLRSFRPNWEHLADDPFRRVGQALEKDAPVHLLTACALVPFEQRTQTVDLLVGAAGRGRPIDWAVLGALEYLTGVRELGTDPDAWKAWWPRVRETYFRAPRPVTPGEPEFRDG